MSDIKPSSDINEFLTRATTIKFLNSARYFVILLETQNIRDNEFYKQSHAALIELYSAGHMLDAIELKYSSAASDFDRGLLFTDNNIGQISQLGIDTYYLEVFDPAYSKEAEPSQGWLVDDFADIYRDLKIELNKIDTIGTDEAIEDALWNMKWSYFNHWGQHCISALRALHFLSYEGKYSL